MIRVLVLFSILNFGHAEGSTPSRLGQLISAVTTDGEAEGYWIELGELFGFTEEMPSKFFEVNRGNFSRAFRAVYAPKSGYSKPVCLFARTYLVNRKNGTSTSTIFRLELDGQLTVAYSLPGKISPDGEPVEGSGTDEKLDITKPSVRADFKRELNFWLNWIAKQKKSKPAPAASTSAQPAKAGPVANSR